MNECSDLRRKNVVWEPGVPRCDRYVQFQASVGEAWGERRGHARIASCVQPWALVLISDSPKVLTARRFRGTLEAGETGSWGRRRAPHTLPRRRTPHVLPS